MPKWQIDASVYLNRLNLDKDGFRNRLNLPDLDNISKVIPLKDLKTIDSLIPASLETITYLIRRVCTLDGRQPFTDASLKMVKLDPRHLKIGQKYVYRENYQNLLEGIPDTFQKFLIGNGGLADLAAYFVFGYDENGVYSLSCYLPPLIEKHGLDLTIMDGIHRNYIVKQSGLTINAILIENASFPFPCAVKDWNEVEVIPSSKKPLALKDRYFELKQGLFRDLKYLGIDG